MGATLGCFLNYFCGGYAPWSAGLSHLTWDLKPPLFSWVCCCDPTVSGFLVGPGIVLKMGVNRVVHYYCSKQLPLMSVPCYLNFKSFGTKNRFNFRAVPCAGNGILYFQGNMLLCHRGYY